MNIDLLIAGYKNNQAQYIAQPTQNPDTLVIACCDSRVDPAIITGCNPGDMFVIRNVANLVPPFNLDLQHHGTSAALEFAVLGLNVKDIIIWGHSNCGGINALMREKYSANASFINSWMDIVSQAKQQVLQQHAECSTEEQAHYCERESLLISLQNLMTFPWIQKRVGDGMLKLHAWYFDVGTGIIKRYEQSNKEFIVL
ncbi:MAG: carbonic anhydrase [Thiotrichales bacterium]|nr:MAG: carbonic anhydrase [Thiotrichales bacterium]